MKEFIEIYYRSREKLETFLENTIESMGELSSFEEDNFEHLFRTFRSLELIYIVDSKSQNQISANIYPNKTDHNAKGKNREYLVNRLEIKSSGYAFTTPYKSVATQSLCVTVTKKEGDKIIFMDFNLSSILERLGMIERHSSFNKVEKSFYTVAGFFMMTIALASLVYAGIDFTSNVLALELHIESIFKPIITATLGLAVFDLAKTILEQEVFYKSYSKDEKNDVKVLTRFLFTILIALAIETLMVVFKIAMQKQGEMVNALYLMGGISFIIVSLSIFIYLTAKSGKTT